MRLNRYFAAATSALLLALGGCGILNNEGSGYVCPNTAILEGPGELVRFTTGSANGPNDVSFRSKMNTVSGTCEVDEKTITMELSIAMEASRGPANTKGEAQFVYFVAILDKDKKILTRTKFPMIAKFKRDETKLDFSESVTVTIPKKKDDLPEEFMVYMGFEMTPEELAYNRNRQRNR